MSRKIDEAADNILKDYLSCDKEVCILCDLPHEALGEHLKGAAKKVHLEVVENKQTIMKIVDKCREKKVFLGIFFEPESFGMFQLYEFLDFSDGQPFVKGLRGESYISILPKESSIRIYGADSVRCRENKEKIFCKMKDNREYRVTTENGTNLYFKSRKWIDDGNEVLTAPVENSINGVIAVDASLFYKKIECILDFYISDGRLVDIKARDEEGENEIKEYYRMTHEAFKEIQNKQLAEVGIGINSGAIISGCFMESEMMFGTCHFCFGNNHCYGGENISDFHGASVLIRNPSFRQVQEI